MVFSTKLAPPPPPSASPLASVNTLQSLIANIPFHFFYFLQILNPAFKTAVPSQKRKQFLRRNNLVLWDNFISPKNQEMKPRVAHKLASLERRLPLFACFPDRQHLLTRSPLNQKFCMCSAQKNDRPTHETTTAAGPVQGKSQSNIRLT